MQNMISGCTKDLGRLIGLIILLINANPGLAGTWFDDSCRRAITIPAEADKTSELCFVDFVTGGHLSADGSDIRVATDDGKQVAAKVVMVGPGDRVCIIFSLAKGAKVYHAYFGTTVVKPFNKPGYDDVKIENGLLMDMHAWAGHPADNYDQIQAAWAKSGPPIGQTVIENLFYGLNPFGPQEQTISKITGTLYAPMDGEYTFSAFTDDRGSLYLDGKRVLFATMGAADIHIQGKIQLTRGKHELLFYHVNIGGSGQFTVAWKRPDSAVFEVVPPTAFGIFARGNVGPLEQLHKTLVADFTTQYAGECFYADGYSHRYKFAAREPKVGIRATYEWDFGDGQKGAGATAEHVYLADDIYPVKLTAHVLTNTDTITNRLMVSRDWPHSENPPADTVNQQSDQVKNYDVAKMPEVWLPRATWLHERAGNTAAMLPAALRLAGIAKHANANQAATALIDASRLAVEKGQVQEAAKLWDAVPAGSDMQPHAARAFGELLLWQIADFPKAVRVLQPYANGQDPVIRWLYADALALNQDAAGRKLLTDMPVSDPAHRAARSGALARTIEFYLQTHDPETGEEQWNNWQQQFPADFLEGYSVVLKTRLMEQKGAPLGAAAVAEAFAKAVPGSSYSPQLLFKAAKLLEKSEPEKSQALIKLLKDRYPEDPLSQ